MTVLGITSLFSTTSIIIMILFIALELTKASIFGIVFLIDNLKQKIPLFIFSALLLIISFMGHFSYLFQQYKLNKVSINSSEVTVTHLQETYEQKKKSIEDQINLLKAEQERNSKELETIQQNINAYTKPNSRNWAQKTNQTRINTLTERNTEINNQTQKLYTDLNNAYQTYSENISKINQANENIANRSIFANTAELIGVSEDKLALSMITILSLVIDSLALTMLWVAGDVFKQAKIDETKIDINNCRRFTFNGISVDDIIKMDDKKVEQIRTKLRSEDQKEWFEAVMKIREQKLSEQVN